MPHVTQAEIFIETLTEMLAEERAHKSARALHLARTRADRFLSRMFMDDVENRTPTGRAAARVPAVLDSTL
ncbi:MAG: hypothetical protein B7Z10_00945 [Rhodobacterales bacterium 32-66-7]|nr:MAG: hypothetical protein B7Z31_03475 [Rhodobacterales bacterium 12-65-15]OYX27223.1 MAG: hypothetical protein B7Z10_00945 [Rhodobacterales bacterium 32-66-7]